MLDTDTATSLAIGLFALTAVLLLFANRAGQTRLGRVLALSSIASVCGANYSMVAAYNGEPPLVYERPGPIERRVIQRRGQFEYVDKEDGSGGGGSGQSASQSSSAGAASDGSAASDAASNAAAGAGSASRSAMASLFQNVSNSAARDGSVKHGDLLKDCPDCPDLVAVAPGFLRMGAMPDDSDAHGAERPRRLVTVPRWFAIGRNEVTLGQYRAFARATGRAAPDCGAGTRNSDPASPATCVSADDARAYRVVEPVLRHRLSPARRDRVGMGGARWQRAPLCDRCIGTADAIGHQRDRHGRTARWCRRDRRRLLDGDTRRDVACGHPVRNRHAVLVECRARRRVRRAARVVAAFGAPATPCWSAQPVRRLPHRARSLIANDRGFTVQCFPHC